MASISKPYLMLNLEYTFWKKSNMWFKCFIIYYQDSYNKPLFFLEITTKLNNSSAYDNFTQTFKLYQLLTFLCFLQVINSQKRFLIHLGNLDRSSILFSFTFFQSLEIRRGKKNTWRQCHKPIFSILKIMGYISKFICGWQNFSSTFYTKDCNNISKNWQGIAKFL